MRGAMRLLFVSPHWSHDLCDRTARLADAGVEVTVASAEATSRHLPRGVKLIRLASRWSVPGGLMRCPARSVKLIRAALRHRAESGEWRKALPGLIALAGCRADVAHVEAHAITPEFVPIIESLECLVVVNCEQHPIDSSPYDPVRRIPDWLRRVVERAAVLNCTLKWTLNEMAGLGLVPARAVVIPPAVDCGFFFPAAGAGTRRREVRIVSVGPLSWCAGYEYALLAMRVLSDRGLPVRYQIVGDGSKAYQQRVWFSVEDLDLKRFVRIRRCLSARERRDLLRESDVFLSPSLVAGALVPTLEAMSCGLPVVSVDAGGMSEIITHGVEGFLVKPREVETMACHLETLAGQPDLRRRMGAAARARAERNFDVDAQSRQLLALYGSLAAPEAAAPFRLAQIGEKAL